MSSPVRILQVLTIMNRGGAETMVMNYFRHMDRSKVQFDFLVHRQDRGAYDDEIEALGGKIYRIPPLFHPLAHRHAVQGFFREHPDYTVIHGHVGELGYFIYREAQKYHVPCIIAHAHNAACDKDWKYPLRIALKHGIRPLCTEFMSCGHEAAQWMFGKKISSTCTMLNNAIEASRYAFDSEERERIRHTMGWSNHWVIGDVARFSPQKNHSFLIETFAELLKQRPDALLVLIGSPDGLYESIKEKTIRLGIENHVQFLGMRTDIPELLQGMDVYCSPSLYEGLSVSMVEAQAAGLRIITSDRVPRQVAICPDLVQFLPLTSDVVPWIQALTASYERRKTYQEIRRAGFDIHENARQLQNFYLKHASQA